MASFPSKAKVVIIGQGGIVGASVAHHLIERGWDDIVGIDKSAIPTDIGSTAHASDFCYATAHDQMTCHTTKYSIDFFERMGRYAKVGGLEVARKGDDDRMAELHRKVASGKAFGTNARIISAREAKEKMPLLEEDAIQGALWDPDAGLVVPRSQVVTGELVEQAEKTGKLQAFANTSATDLNIVNGKIVGVETTRGYIEADYVVVCAGLWGRLIAQMAGEDLPVMPVDHPLLWFGPYKEFEGTGKDIGYPLLRDQGNSAYLRDTGDPKTSEGGMIEWGYYEEKEPRLCHPRDILEKEESRLSPSQRDLDMEQIMEPLEKAMELTPILGELGYDEKRSFNGLLQVTADGGPSLGESARAHGYASNDHLLDKFAEKIPERLNEWDARHFWRVSNAEHLQLSEDVGMVNLSHFAIYDISGTDAEALMEYACVARVGGQTPVGKGVYTHFLDHKGGVRADLTVIRMAEDHFRVIDGGDSGNRDFIWLKRMSHDRDLTNLSIEDRTTDFACLGIWGPNARTTLAKVITDESAISDESFPFAAVKTLQVNGVDVAAFRISYVGEQGWELHFKYEDGLKVWDALAAEGVTPIGVETYANSRRLEKSLRLQNADLLTEYNLLEADLARPKVKPADFHGKDAYLALRDKQTQVAYLCTLTMTDNVDSHGVPRFPVGTCPILDERGGKTLIDDLGRRSYTTSIAYGPSIGKNIALGYLPEKYCKIGTALYIEYFGEQYAVQVESVGYKPLYDPENLKPRS